MTAQDIKALRKAHKWSTTDLAEMCGVSGRTVEGWEQGRKVSRPAGILLYKLIEQTT